MDAQHELDRTVLEVWSAAGFADEEARAWLAAAATRFTPHTALAWRREGFGPSDAALWSEVYADPVAARVQRNEGWGDPFDCG